jgi:hypothetical protein
MNIINTCFHKSNSIGFIIFDEAFSNNGVVV